MAPVWRASRRDNRFEVLSFEYVDGRQKAKAKNSHGFARIEELCGRMEDAFNSRPCNSLHVLDPIIRQ